MKHIQKNENLFNLLKQFIKFGIVGISNTLISLLVYYILVYLNINYIIAYTIGFICSVINAFFWNSKYVFKAETERNVIKSFIKVFIAYGFTFFIGTGLLFLLVDEFNISDLLAPIINLFITVPMNFLLNKFWAMKEKKNEESKMTSKELAWKIRRDAIEMTHVSNGSHIGCVLSIADIVGVLYADVMDVDKDNPRSDDRDRFILSKGHAGAAVYAALAETGFFPVEDLVTYYANGSKLSGHVSHKGVPGIELSTGSLGHGICVAVGMAMASKIDKKKHRVYTVIGDGECNEGSIWESALFANQFKLNNLTVVVDHNKIQSLDWCKNTIDLINLTDKWKAFGWHVIEVDGHNHDELKQAFTEKSQDKPVCIIAHTIKGKGVSFMENQVLWHYRAPQGEFYINAVKELEENR